jgi:enamine deaminase RidA (YjgF/YER057c/UK114 family)
MVLTRSKTLDGWDINTLELPGYQEHIITVDIGDDVTNMQGMAHKISEMGMEVLQQFVLAGCKHYGAGLKAMGSVDWPLTWVHGDACKGGEMHSSQILAVSGIPTEPVMLEGKVVGRIYEDINARYCRLAGIIPGDLSGSMADQTRSVFDRIQQALQSVGMEFTDVVRTWLYLDDLLKWYDEFNVVRTAFFNQYGVFDRMVPASTGIGAANPFGAALLADACAVVPKNGLCTIEAVPSPLQCPALSYKSSFSRAVEILFPTHRQLMISGTASILPDGRTAHIDNPVKQVELTMKVVETILESRGMGWNEVTRGIAYFKDMRYLPIYNQYCSENNIASFPLAVSHADICRDDLLFEIEVDAVRIGHDQKRQVIK